eukprot:gene5035-biopygen19134
MPFCLQPLELNKTEILSRTLCKGKGREGHGPCGPGSSGGLGGSYGPGGLAAFAALARSATFRTGGSGPPPIFWLEIRGVTRWSMGIVEPDLSKNSIVGWVVWSGARSMSPEMPRPQWPPAAGQGGWEGTPLIILAAGAARAARVAREAAWAARVASREFHK